MGRPAGCDCRFLRGAFRVDCPNRFPTPPCRLGHADSLERLAYAALGLLHLRSSPLDQVPAAHKSRKPSGATSRWPQADREKSCTAIVADQPRLAVVQNGPDAGGAQIRASRSREPARMGPTTPAGVTGVSPWDTLGDTDSPDVPRPRHTNWAIRHSEAPTAYQAA